MAGTSGTTGVIRAVVFSSDGVRLALVIAAGDGTSEVWVGAVVRSGQDVRVGELTSRAQSGALGTRLVLGETPFRGRGAVRDRYGPAPLRATEWPPQRPFPKPHF